MELNMISSNTIGKVRTYLENNDGSVNMADPKQKKELLEVTGLNDQDAEGLAKLSDLEGQHILSSLDIKVLDIEDNFPVEHPGSFSKIKTKSGVQIEVLYNAKNKKNVVIMPGDSAPAWMYRDLANKLFAQGANVYTVNYYNYDGSDTVPPDTITDELYLKNMKDAISEIESRFGAKNATLVGHSRGTTVIQKYLEDSGETKKVILIGAVFDASVGDMPSDLTVVRKALFKIAMNCRRGSFRFDKDYYLERFFEKGAFSDAKVSCAYSYSAELPNDLMLSTSAVDYSKYSVAHDITVITSKDDQALTAEYQTTCVANMKKLKNLESVKQVLVSGSHFSLVEHPEDVTGVILGE